MKAGKSGNFPRCLQNVHVDSTGGAQGQNYKYPHAYPNHWVKQQYLPDELKNVQYYHYGRQQGRARRRAVLGSDQGVSTWT